MTVQNAKNEAYNSSLIEGRPPSCAHLLQQRVKATPSADGYLFFEGEDLVHVSWQQTWDEVSTWAAGLIDLGVEMGERVAICSSTRKEWIWANWGIMLAGAATTTVYPTSHAEAVSYILGDSGSRVVFAEDMGQVEKLRVRRHELPDVVAVVVFDLGAEERHGALDDWVMSLDQLIERGRARLEAEPNLVQSRIDALTPESLSTIIYTSGTTGNPKGAELTHDSLVYEGVATASIAILSDDDLAYLWLPLSHVFGNVLIMIAVATGSPTCVDGRIDRIVPNLAIVKPTWMGAAPRIFEKAYAGVNATLGEATGAKAKLIAWAFGVGRKVAEHEEAGKAIPAGLKAQHRIADKLVFSKIKERFGGRIRLFISGSARLEPELSWWFRSVGLPITEGYGLTETSAATTVNRLDPGTHKHGSIGWPLPGTDIKIAEDGEVLVKGPGVMKGYHNKPDATAEAFTEDGYFRTGDIGEIDENGFVSITDRKKDVFKTSGGKYISPSLIEARFKQLCPYVGQFLVVGDQRNYAVALVTLDPEAAAKWAEANGMSGASYEEIVTSDKARQMVQGYIDELNAGLNRWETIKKFTLLENDLTVDSGDLTPSMKLRRRAVSSKYEDTIEALYAE
ncbi:MAG: long-chain fatty acid--CoA ligase [Mobilicoccus sp.]|nr:long-chain fatty acid--CoA ligase [Mobilicoccus sp.]